MNFNQNMESLTNHEHAPEVKCEILVDKSLNEKRVFEILGEYPDNFFTGMFEDAAKDDYKKSDIIVGIQNNEIVSCLFFDPKTNEFNWLAVSKKADGYKSEISKAMFQKVFDSLPIFGM